MDTVEQKKSRKMDMLTAIEHIVEKVKDSQLSTEFYRKSAKYIKYVSDKQELSKEQSVMMALFIDNSDDECIRLSDMGKYIGCSTTRLIRYMNDIDVLERRGLILCSRRKNSISYRVPFEIIEAFRKDEKYVPKDCSGLTCSQLFSELENLFDMREDNELSYKALCERINHLLDSNKQLLFVQKLKSYNFDESDELLLILFSHLFVNNNDDNIGFHDLDFIYGNEHRILWNIVKGKLNSGKSLLMEAKMIEYNNNDGFVNRESYRMTSMAKKDLFEELNLSSLNQTQNVSGMIKSGNITKKDLFYDASVKQQIADLTQLLDENHYQIIRSRMKEAGFRCGFNCLFYGSPGTGKTETVLQLARKTGRDILQVNVSEIKSMWVGESEKNIKNIFDTYRKKVSESEITPILLFNEADAIIGKRREGAEKAADKMENTIQNIILQEMETLNGILIATTNLAQNMDSAFERRFLYKIKFAKPTLDVRMKIWNEMIPTLGEADSRVLASKYDFSGGQIENIARHYTIDNILYGKSENPLEKLLGHCENEKIEKKEYRRIGF